MFSAARWRPKDSRLIPISPPATIAVVEADLAMKNTAVKLNNYVQLYTVGAVCVNAKSVIYWR